MTNSDLIKSIRDVVRDELAGFATKDDLKDFTTKEDLKNFATKEDLKNFATKEDLKSMEERLETKFATKNDLKGMEDRLDRKLSSLRRSNTQHHLKTREEVGYLNKKFGDVQDGLKQAAGLV